MNKNEIINAIFYPRKSFIEQDENDLLIEVEKGIKVAARLFLKNNSNVNILYFHGNAELSQEYDSIAKIYNQYDMNLVVADYRGYGLSDGIPDKENLHCDAVKIFDYICKYLHNKFYTGKLIVMGRSLGSASACEIISKREKDIGGCIIESGFATEYPLLELMNIDAENIQYSLPDGFQNLKKIKGYKKSICFIHADLDEIIPFSEAELMIKESPSIKKKLFVADGAGHNNIIMVMGTDYFKNIKEFIDEL